MNNQGSGALLCLVPGLLCGFPTLLILVTALIPTYFDRARRIVSTHPVGVTVFGFDAYVSYAYAGGTELREIAPPK